MAQRLQLPRRGKLMTIEHIQEPNEYPYENLAPGVFLYRNIFDPAGIKDMREEESAHDWPY